LADAGAITLYVDGVPFAPSSTDPLLISAGLEWLSDAAALAQEYLATPFDRGLSPEGIAQRLRTIRIRRCNAISLDLGGEQLAAIRSERVQAFPHSRLPTLLVAFDGRFDWTLLLEAMSQLTRLLATRGNTLEQLLYKLYAT
jgi:hypothetical protein